MSEKRIFDKALLPDGWHDQVMIETDEYTIVDIQPNAQVTTDATVTNQFAVPGLTNVHSHAFQHAFAGHSEYRTNEHDSFWTWRSLMYQFVESLTPDQVFEIAKTLYRRMKQAGYCSVGEFHYLLHRPDGKPFDNINAMADALINAAIDCELDICMLPVLYQRGGFDDRPLVGGQTRFGSSTDLYLEMLTKLKTDWGGHPRVRLGVALHSLRAVSIKNATDVIEQVETILPECPIHIHVAEQTKEVEDCVQANGKRPVQLLLDSMPVDKRWCLIHATHLTDSECQRIAKSQAVVGVCPTTEANLGDGIFRSEDYLQQGGALAIGSDSHITVDPYEELRWLEYAQRLIQHRRAVLCTNDQSCGSLLYQWACRGGDQVTGFDHEIRIGASSNFTTLATEDHPADPADRILDHRIFYSH